MCTLGVRQNYERDSFSLACSYDVVDDDLEIENRESSLECPREIRKDGRLISESDSRWSGPADAVHIVNAYIKWWVMHKEVYVLFGLF